MFFQPGNPFMTQQQQQQQQEQQQASAFWEASASSQVPGSHASALQRYLHLQRRQQQQQQQQNQRHQTAQDSQRMNMEAQATLCGEDYCQAFYQLQRLSIRYKELKQNVKEKFEVASQAMIRAGRNRLPLPDGSCIVRKPEKIEFEKPNFVKTFGRMFRESLISINDPALGTKPPEAWLELELKRDADKLKTDIENLRMISTHEKLKAPEMRAFLDQLPE